MSGKTREISESHDSSHYSSFLVIMTLDILPARLLISDIPIWNVFQMKIKAEKSSMSDASGKKLESLESSSNVSPSLVHHEWLNTTTKEKQTLPIKHRSVTRRDSRRWRGARLRTLRWARCRCSAALSRRGSFARFRLRFRCLSSSRSCLEGESRVSDTTTCLNLWTHFFGASRSCPTSPSPVSSTHPRRLRAWPLALRFR